MITITMVTNNDNDNNNYDNNNNNNDNLKIIIHNLLEEQNQKDLDLIVSHRQLGKKDNQPRFLLDGLLTLYKVYDKRY